MLNSYNNKTIGTKTKFLILDILDLQAEGWGLKEKKEITNYGSNRINSRKNSEFTNRRKSSINPKDVEYIRRSRFNSMADELKTSKIEDPTLILNELVKSLGADIEFYQCFKLTEEEFVLFFINYNFVK